VYFSILFACFITFSMKIESRNKNSVLTFREIVPAPLWLADLTLSSQESSRVPSNSEPSLSLVLPSEPVDVVDEVESFPDTFGLASENVVL